MKLDLNSTTPLFLLMADQNILDRFQVVMRRFNPLLVFEVAPLLKSDHPSALEEWVAFFVRFQSPTALPEKYKGLVNIGDRISSVYSGGGTYLELLEIAETLPYATFSGNIQAYLRG